MAACSQCGTVLPAEAQFCPACAAPVERRPPPTEERKLATVVFADLVGSTALADSQDPERTRALLDRFYDAMAAEIERAGGTIEKFAGDAVMAAFGAPAAVEDHAERALHAALAMRRRLEEAFGDRLALRIGVNAGEVVVGRAREGSSFVTGDMVNVAARLEEAAATPGQILVGERTATAVRGAFEFEAPETVAAKGKPSGVACQRLVRALSLNRPRGIGGLGPAFVGRETELGRLRDAYRSAVSERRPRLVSIIGDAGVGKTRLVRELWAWLADQELQPLQRTGRCLSYGQGITYWPLAEVLREHFGLLEDDSAEAVVDRLRAHPFLGLTLGLTVGRSLHPLVARERLHDSWLQLLDDLVKGRPTVLLIEDVHWAEDDLLDLLATLVQHVRGPLLLITTARPEVRDIHPGWGSGPEATVLRLAALSDRDTGRLLDELLDVELPDSVRAAVVERAEGNPFFVEELIATLLDTGALRRDDDGWSFGELPDGFRVPDSVQAVLAARIDLLPGAEKSALQAASVIGRVFWSGPVYVLVDGQPDLGLLEERDFVHCRSGSSVPGEREYVIKHALTREVAYESQPKATRAHRHAAFASWLERTGLGRDEHAGLLAHHYWWAVRPEDQDLAWPDDGERVEQLRARAVEWSRRAAQLAVARYEIDEALSLLHHAVALESRPDREAVLWQEIGHAEALWFDGEAFRAAMERAIALAGPSAELYGELALQTARRSGMWKRLPNQALVDGWIDQALGLAEAGSTTHAKALAAAALWRRDEAAARALHAIAVRCGDVDLRSNSLAALTDVAWSAGDLQSARRWLEERLALLPELSDPDDCHFAQMTAVCAYLALARLPDAARACEQLELLVQGLTPHHRVHAVSSRVYVETVRGCWDVVRELTPMIEQTVKANDAAPCTGNASSLLRCAVAGAYTGDDAEAGRLESEAAEQMLEGQLAYYHAHRLRLMLARSDVVGLERLVGSIDLAAVPDSPYRFDQPPAILDALVALGDHKAIEQMAPRWLRPGTYAEPFALRALGVARGDAELLDEASRRFEAIGLGWRADETERWRVAR